MSEGHEQEMEGGRLVEKRGWLELALHVARWSTPHIPWSDYTLNISNADSVYRLTAQRDELLGNLTHLNLPEFLAKNSSFLFFKLPKMSPSSSLSGSKWKKR